MKKLIALLLIISLAIPVFAFPADAAEKLLGDVNGDGRITVSDATAVQRHIAGDNRSMAERDRILKEESL